MLLYKVLVRKRASTIDSRTARPVTMEKVAALDHEVLDLERMPLVTGGMLWSGIAWLYWEA
jgi:hypothetical protein